MAKLTLHHMPRSRAFTTLWLLEELGVPYELNSFTDQNSFYKSAEHLAMHPMGKVPAVVESDGTVVSETGAIAIYLSDKYRAEAVLSPSLEAAERAAFLRWCFFAAAIIEPAYAQAFTGWDKITPSQAAWGSFEQMLEVAAQGCADASPWLLGADFTAADLVVASGLRFGLMFGVVKDQPAIEAFVDRASAREAFKRASEIEENAASDS